MDNRVFSFSIAKDNTDAIVEVAKLKGHARKTGISFSFLIIKAVKMLNESIEDDN